MNSDSKATFNLPAIVSQFAVAGTILSIEPVGAGHIHDTYQVKNAEAGQPDYLLQRINHQVFKNIPALMQNIVLVTTHLRQKLSTTPGANPQKEVLTLVPARSGAWYITDETGNYWRLYYFIANTSAYDKVETLEQAYEGGKAFGKFNALLADMPAELVQETIPDFHNIRNRLKLFHEAIGADVAGQVKEVAGEIRKILSRAERMGTIQHLGETNQIPMRITHNDTKFNNVLLNKNNKAQCVIDLDTVMPGYIAYDFGDAIRTSVNTATEDAFDLTKINVNIDLLKSFTQGFLQQTKAFLSAAEITSLYEGVLLMPYIMAVRFLTDYLAGDYYYKIHFPGHNLQRARAQLQLLFKLEEQAELIKNIILEASLLKNI